MWAGSQLAVCAWKAVDDQEWDRPILQHENGRNTETSHHFPRRAFLPARGP